MTKKEIVLIQEGDEEDERYFEYRDRVNPEYQKILSHEITLKQLADFCDQNAESRNNHSFVGTHRILTALLARELGKEQATHLMQEIAERGGLDAMSGLYATGFEPAFAEFGIEDFDADWEI